MSAIVTMGMPIEPQRLPGASALYEFYALRGGISLSSVAFAPDVTAPALTLSGSLALPAGPIGLVVVITTSGTQTTMIFKWSTNDGATYTTGVAGAAAVALGSTGITANFAAGAYVAGQTYFGRPGTVPCLWIPSTNSMSPTAAAGVYLQQNAGPGGLSILRLVGSATVSTTTVAASVLTTGTNVSFTLFVVFKMISLTATFVTLVDFVNFTTGAARTRLQARSTQYRTQRTSDAAVTSSLTGGTPNTTQWHIGELVFDGSGGTNLKLIIDGTTVINAASTVGLQSTPNVIALGSAAGGTSPDMMWGETVTYVGALSAAVRNPIRRYLKVKWQTP